MGRQPPTTDNDTDANEVSPQVKGLPPPLTHPHKKGLPHSAEVAKRQNDTWYLAIHKGACLSAEQPNPKDRKSPRDTDTTPLPHHFRCISQALPAAEESVRAAFHTTTGGSRP